MKKEPFLFRDKYEKWLRKHSVSEASLNAYCLQTKYPGTDLTYFDVIGAFAYHKEILLARAAYEQWKQEIENSRVSQKTKQNKFDYIAKYNLFFEEIIASNSATLTKSDKERLHFIEAQLHSIASSIEDAIETEDSPAKGIQIDGMDLLIAHIGEEQFIKLAIESSYFFSAELCQMRFDQITALWNNATEVDTMFSRCKNKHLPARYSTDLNQQRIEGDSAYFVVNGVNQCKIYQENNREKDSSTGGGNGNARVCQLIKNTTGYDLGAPLNKKSFKNYIISHIWGNATDPRYFTNLWNIAIVPAWANHLLDKDETGTLSAALKERIKCIICKIIAKAQLNWGSIQLPQPVAANSMGETYNINIINAKADGERFGRITQERIPI